MWYDDGIVTLTTHGKNTLDIPATEPGDRHRHKGPRDICGVLPSGTEVGGVTSRRVSRKRKHPREDQRTIHVLVLKVKCDDHI